MRLISDYPGGNGRLVCAAETADGWEISFCAECRLGEPKPLWFCFRLEELGGRPVQLRLVNSMDCLGDPDGWPGDRPVWRTLPDGTWQRVTQAENLPRPDGGTEACFSVPAGVDRLEFAFCYPYTAADLERTLRQGPCIRREELAVADGGKPLLRLSVGENADAPGVYLLARQHAGEVSGSWVLDGLMRWLAGPQGIAARRSRRWWIVPLVDAEGVERGCYGKDQSAGDFNRSWNAFGEPLRPELAGLQQDILTRHREDRVDLLLDLHGPSHQRHSSYFVMRTGTPPQGREKLLRLREELNALLTQRGYQPFGVIEPPGGLPIQSPADGGSAVGCCNDTFLYANGMFGCPVECSYQGEENARTYTVEDYRCIGASLAQALASFPCGR